jgi:hypothetical protein
MTKMSFVFRLIILLVGFILVEWKGRDQNYALANLANNYKRPFRFLIYYAIIISIILWAGKEQQFIYFQF